MSSKAVATFHLLTYKCCHLYFLSYIIRIIIITEDLKAILVFSYMGSVALWQLQMTAHLGQSGPPAHRENRYPLVNLLRASAGRVPNIVVYISTIMYHNLMVCRKHELAPL